MSITFGDSVKVILSAPKRFKPGIIGSLCGKRVLDREEYASAFGVSMNTIVWIVECQNGSSIEIPEEYLIPIGK